jgi:hypothetical protein
MIVLVIPFPSPFVDARFMSIVQEKCRDDSQFHWFRESYGRSLMESWNHFPNGEDIWNKAIPLTGMLQTSSWGVDMREALFTLQDLPKALIVIATPQPALALYESSDMQIDS